MVSQMIKVMEENGQDFKVYTTREAQTEKLDELVALEDLMSSDAASTDEKTGGLHERNLNIHFQRAGGTCFLSCSCFSDIPQTMEMTKAAKAIQGLPCA